MTEVGTWRMQGAPLRSAEPLLAVREFAPVLAALWKAAYFGLYATLERRHVQPRQSIESKLEF